MKYYKVTNKDEMHNGIQYQDGLNVDRRQFRTGKTGRGGGIYYAREDIFVYFDYGLWLREVRIPENTVIHEEKGTPTIFKSPQVELMERREIDLDVIKELAEEGADLFAGRNALFNMMVTNNDLKGIEYLVEKGIKLTYHNKENVLFFASLIGDMSIIRLLEKSTSFYGYCNSTAIESACKRGHLDLVKYMVEELKVDIHADNDYPFQWACDKGQLSIAKYLVSKGAIVDTDNNASLHWACENGHLNIVRYLINVCGLTFTADDIKTASEYNRTNIVRYLNSKLDK